MKKVAIVTDTTACVPAREAAAHGIEIIPVPLLIDDRMYRDGIDITPEQFYALLRKASKTPTTSASAPEPYLNAFIKAVKDAETIVCFTEPAHFSAMYNSATIARQSAASLLPDTRIEIIEGTTAAAGLGLVAMAAARAATAGKTLEETVSAARDTMSRMKLYASLDTLKYLVKSGRVPQAASLLNSILAIKPVFTLNHAEPRTVALPRTMRGAIDRMAKLVGETGGGGQPLHAAVMHADALENATILRERISAEFNCREIYITEFTPVMGAHTGPGLVGVAFYAESIPG